MNIQHIKYFIYLSELKSFTKAAAKARVVQSTFSSAIKRLEQHLDTQLFVRDNRKVLLTVEGAVLLKKAKDLVALWNEMENYAKPSSETVLTLGIDNDIDYDSLVPLLTVFNKSHPHVTVQVLEENQAQLLSLLESKKIDACLSKDIQANTANYKSKIICKNKLVIAVSKSHRYADTEKLELKAINGENFVERTDCSVYQKVLVALQRAGIKPHIVVKAKSDEMTRAIISSGIAIGIVPHIPNASSENLSYIAISDYTFYEEIHLTWSANNSSGVLKDFLVV